MAPNQLRSQERWFKVTAVIFTMVPFVLIGIIACNDLYQGETSGIWELALAAPLAILAIVGWRRPLQGGQMLAGMGAVLACIYGFLMAERGTEVLLDGLFTLCIPPIVGGLIFLLVAWAEDRNGLTS